MTTTTAKNTLSYAEEMDRIDPLAKFREEFCFPKGPRGQDVIYLAGNSLGLQPKKARVYVEQELADWERFGVEGHFHAKNPWLPYHEALTEPMARVVGAKPSEVVVMNSLTVNLHLMMVSFYRPTRERYKILVERGAFPSDQYAVASQARFHGFDPGDAILEARPRPGENTIREEDLLELIAREGRSIALVMLGSVNYLTGQAFDIAAITRAAHAQGCKVGFDLAHGAGNLAVKLHDWGPDFAVWCSYKYLNAGPGALAGAFVHERHARDSTLPRFAGWWGHDKKTRFLMGPEFHAIPGAEGWQLSNPPILSMAPLRASLELFDAATMSELRRKGDLITGYLEFLLSDVPGVQIVTPRDPARRGSQLSLRFPGIDGRVLLKQWSEAGIIADFREPDIIRATPAPLYCRFVDVYRFAEELRKNAKT